MATGASGVKIMSGDLPKYFNFGTPQTPVTSITANGNSLALYKETPYSSFQMTCYSSTFGALTATVNIQVSNDLMTGQGVSIQCTSTTSSAFLSSSCLLYTSDAADD